MEKESRKSNLKIIVFIAVLSLLAIVSFYAMPYFIKSLFSSNKFVLLDSIRIGKKSVQFYTDYGHDSAVLGFYIEDQEGRVRYFPIYCSTYRGIPSVKLTVFLSDTKEAFWILSSWPGYETLAYYRVGNEHCITHYGEITYFDKPTPKSIGGGNKKFPDMDTDRVKKVLTVIHNNKEENASD